MTRKESRTVTINGEQRQQEYDVPYQITEMTTRTVTTEAPWSPSNGTAYEPSGLPITPASAALERLQSGDPVAWMQGMPTSEMFQHPLANPVKMLLASPAATPRPSSPPGGVPPSPTPTVPMPPPTATDASSDEKDVVAKVNEARAAASLPPLQVDARLTTAARKHSANMARQQRLEHVLDGKSPRDRITEAGAQPTFTGENCAQGQTSAAAALES